MDCTPRRKKPALAPAKPAACYPLGEIVRSKGIDWQSRNVTRGGKTHRQWVRMSKEAAKAARAGQPPPPSKGKGKGKGKAKATPAAKPVLDYEQARNRRRTGNCANPTAGRQKLNSPALAPSCARVGVVMLGQDGQPWQNVRTKAGPRWKRLVGGVVVPPSQAESYGPYTTWAEWANHFDHPPAHPEKHSPDVEYADMVNPKQVRFDGRCAKSTSGRKGLRTPLISPSCVQQGAMAYGQEAGTTWFASTTAGGVPRWKEYKGPLTVRNVPAHQGPVPPRPEPAGSLFQGSKNKEALFQNATGAGGNPPGPPVPANTVKEGQKVQYRGRTYQSRGGKWILLAAGAAAKASMAVGVGADAGTTAKNYKDAPGHAPDQYAWQADKAPGPAEGENLPAASAPSTTPDLLGFGDEMEPIPISPPPPQIPNLPAGGYVPPIGGGGGADDFAPVYIPPSVDYYGGGGPVGYIGGGGPIGYI